MKFKINWNWSCALNFEKKVCAKSLCDMKQARSILVQTDLLPWRHMHRPDQSTERERERERKGVVEKLQEEVKESVQ